MDGFLKQWLRFFCLGGVLSLVVNYPKLIHACNSYDVVHSKFGGGDRGCYAMRPRVVPCAWHQTAWGSVSGLRGGGRP